MEPPHSAPQTGLQARLLGPLHLAVDGRLLADHAWPRRTSRSLLLMLLAAPGHRLPRDAVLDALWPETPPEVAARSLYVAIHGLRRVLEPGVTSGRASRFVESVGDGLRLRPEAGLDVDVVRFEAALDTPQGDRCQSLSLALSLYAGDLLADEPYADWPVARRDELRWRWREAVLEYAGLVGADGRPLLAVAPLERVLRADPTDEAACRAIMHAYAGAGRRDDALRQYERCVRALAEDLDTAPVHETRELARAIQQAPAAVVDIATAGRIEVLPAPPNPLIGRDRVMDDLVDLLCQPSVRLVTITGPGGIGKTRLAIETASLARDEFAGGVCFVALAHIHDARLVLPAIARVLGLEESPSRTPLATLQERLGNAHLLLVLDNLEQVPDAATDLADLLGACPELTLLATSRAPLHLRAEHVVPLDPLPVPPGRLPATASSLGRYPAVELFVQRAQAVRRDFDLTDANASAIANLCVKLDGFPLAIELAAARVRQFDLESLVAGLTDRFGLLAEGFRDLPERQRTMWATIAWSFDLLTPEEQRNFSRLSRFAGGFDASAAFVVAAASGSILANLAGKGLLTQESRPEPRYGMYETIRDFAARMLRRQGEERTIADMHAAWALDLVERAEPELTGDRQAAWFDRLELELPNARAAFEYLLGEPARTDEALRLAAAPWRFFWSRGYTRNGLDWLQRALAQPIPGSAPVRAKALYAMAEMAFTVGDYRQAGAAYDEALALRTALGDETGAAEVLNGLGLVARQHGDFDRAATLHQDALRRLEHAGDRRGVASCLGNLGAIAYYRGDATTCERYWQQAVAIVRELRDHRSVIMILGNLGALALMQQDAARAITCHEEALALARRIGDRHGIRQTLANLGGACFEQGDLDRAAAMFVESLALSQEDADQATQAIIHFNLGQVAERRSDLERAATHYVTSIDIFEASGNLPAVASCLERIGVLVAAHDAAEIATACLAAAQAIRDETGAARETVDHGTYAEDLASIRERLGTAVFTAAWDAGIRRPLAEVIGDARAILQPSPAASR